MLLSLKDVTKRYGKMVALHPISLEIKGEICGMIGNNGAGKSTLMKMVVGLLTPGKGTITLDGTDIRQSPEEIKRQLGYLPEAPLLYPKLTAEEMLYYVAEVKGIAAPDKEITGWLETFGLLEKRTALLNGLSFGMKKKISLSAAFLGKPKLLILDEPFNGLDVATMEHLSDIITQCHRDGATILISSHLMEYIDRLCHRVIILKKGHVVSEGNPAELKKETGKTSFHDTFLHLTRDVGSNQEGDYN